MKSIALGSDDAGAPLRAAIREHLERVGCAYEDYGTDDSQPTYPVIAENVARQVAAGRHERAILLCGTGVGVCIAANKVPGVFAALCHDNYSAERARKSNNAQILAMGARVVGQELALNIVDTWLGSEFEGGRSIPKVEALRSMDRRFRGAQADQ